MPGAVLRAGKQQQQSSVLLELPASFDAAGDSGVIGRIMCSWVSGSNGSTTVSRLPVPRQSQLGHQAGRAGSRDQQQKQKQPEGGNEEGRQLELELVATEMVEHHNGGSITQQAAAGGDGPAVPGSGEAGRCDTSDEEDACWQDYSHTENPAGRQAAAVQLDLKGT